jgi:dihydropyrimidinase
MNGGGPAFDLVVRNARIATGADVYQAAMTP